MSKLEKVIVELPVKITLEIDVDGKEFITDIKEKVIDRIGDMNEQLCTQLGDQARKHNFTGEEIIEIVKEDGTCVIPGRCPDCQGTGQMGEIGICERCQGTGKSRKKRIEYWLKELEKAAADDGYFKHNEKFLNAFELLNSEVVEIKAEMLHEMTDNDSDDASDNPCRCDEPDDIRDKMPWEHYP